MNKKKIECESRMTENTQIIIYFVLFLLFIVVIHQLYLQPQMEEKKKKRELQEKWKKMQSQEDRAIKSSQSIHNPMLDYGNSLPNEDEIRIEDSFSESQNPISKTEFQNLVESGVPTLNTQQCWYSKEFECPPKNGSYYQCTNNYIPKPNQKNCDCSNRTFEMCPFPYKISENEYYKKINFKRPDNFYTPFKNH